MPHAAPAPQALPIPKEAGLQCMDAHGRALCPVFARTNLKACEAPLSGLLSDMHDHARLPQEAATKLRRRTVALALPLLLQFLVNVNALGARSQHGMTNQDLSVTAEARTTGFWLPPSPISCTALCASHLSNSRRWPNLRTPLAHLSTVCRCCAHAATISKTTRQDNQNSQAGTICRKNAESKHSF